MQLPLGRHRGSREAGRAPVAVALILLALVIIAFLLLPPAAAGAQEISMLASHAMYSDVEVMRPPLL